eukprot:sb/3469417/
MISSVHLGSAWELKDESGATCLEITGTISLKITYNDTDTDASVINTSTIPSDLSSESVTGSCSTTDSLISEMTLKWDTYQLDMSFTVDDRDEWTMSKNELTFNNEKTAMDSIPIAAHSNAYYHCKSDKSFTLLPDSDVNQTTTIESVEFITSELTIRPFPGLQIMESCSDDPVPTEAKPTDPPKKVTTKPPVQPTEAPVKHFNASNVLIVLSFMAQVGTDRIRKYCSLIG